MIRPIRSFAATLLVALFANLLMLSAALAHAALVTSDPADGAVLAEAPAAITFTFTEPVTPLVFTFVSADGSRQSLDGATAQNETVRLPLPQGLATGTHLVSWRIASADGHPVGGSLVFSIGAATALPVLSLGADPLRDGAIWLVRTALYAALFLGVGLAVYGLTVAPLSGRLVVLPRRLGLAGLLLAPLALGLQGIDALDLGLGALLSAAPWSAALATTYSLTVLAMLVAFAATFGATLLQRGPVRTLLVLLAWLSAALAPMLSGHAGTAQPQLLSRSMVVLHIGGLVFWIGALLPLGAALRSGDVVGLARFSRLIPVAITPVVLSGLVLAALQMGLPGAGWTSPYALLLGAKLLLLAPLFGLALWNRVALTRPALAGAPAAQHKLRRSIVVELLLVLLVFGVVAGWRFTPPPRVLAEIAAVPAETHAMDEAGQMAEITVTPGHAGESLMRLWLTDENYDALTAQAVTVALSNPALGVERLERPASLGDDGFWQAPLLLPVGGTWTVEVEIRIDDFTLARLTGELELSP